MIDPVALLDLTSLGDEDTAEDVRDHGAGGEKVSGGVRTAAQARAYVALAEEVLGAGRVSPATLRIGASGLLDALLAEHRA